MQTYGNEKSDWPGSTVREELIAFETRARHQGQLYVELEQRVHELEEICERVLGWSPTRVRQVPDLVISPAGTRVEERR